MTETTKSEVEIAESTAVGRMEMAAAEASLDAVGLLNRAVRASGLSQRELAEALGVGESRVSQVLSGDGNLRMTTLARYLRATGYRLRLDAVPDEEGVSELPSKTKIVHRRNRASQEVAQEKSSGSSWFGMIPLVSSGSACGLLNYRLNNITFGERPKIPAEGISSPTVLEWAVAQSIDLRPAERLEQDFKWQVVHTTTAQNDRDAYADHKA